MFTALEGKLGKRGGKRCLETMTKRQRQERARKAANARWEAHRAKQAKRKGK